MMKRQAEERILKIKKKEQEKNSEIKSKLAFI